MKKENECLSCKLMKLTSNYYLQFVFFIALFFGAIQSSYAIELGGVGDEKVVEKSAVGCDNVKAWKKAFDFPNSRIKTGVLERLSTKYKNVLDDIKNINEEFLESANNHLDLGGHNRYPDAVKIVTDPLDYNGLPIKNHIEGQVETFLPKFDSGSMSKLTAESFPVTPQIATDMKRVIQDGGEIGIMNSQSFVDQYVALFDDITGSVSYGTFTDDFGIDYITAVITVAK